MGRDLVAVIIVGGGPTGLAAANLLGGAGIETLLLERSAVLSDRPRAISIDDEGLRICQAMGLRNEVLENVLLDIGAQYCSAGRLLVRVSPTSRRNGYPLISTFNQPELEETLLGGLRRFACVDVCFQHTLEAFEQTERGVIVSVRTPTGRLQRIECSYLLACDGGRSEIRRALGIALKGATFQQKWLVVDSIHDDDPTRFATFFCDPARPAVSVPAPHNGRRWEFMLLPGETEAEMLDEEIIRALIRRVGGARNPRITRQVIYTFHAALASSLSRGRVFLLGDAAHLMPPFGGQGMNSGLRDAHNLAWKIALVLRGQADPALLNTYHQERHGHVAQMIRFSSFLGSIIMPTQRPAAFIRDGALRAATAIPGVRNFLKEAGIKPPPKYKRGCLLPGGSRASRAITGLMLPQPEVVTLQGERVLLDDVLGDGFALLRLHDNPGAAFAGIRDDIWQRLGTRFVCIRPARGGESEPAEGRFAYVVVDDIQGQMSGFLRGNRELCVVVRPDRYILGAFEVEKTATFEAALKDGMRGEERAKPPPDSRRGRGGVGGHS